MLPPFFSQFLEDESQTLAFGARLGAIAMAGDFVALHGALGAGKTTIARGYIRAFVDADVDVPSPTFTLVQTYNSGKLTQPTLDLFHFDLYRLKSAQEVWELGWEDIASGVALVEWAINAGEYLPAKRLDVHLAAHDGGRWLHLSAHESDFWKDRLNGV